MPRSLVHNVCDAYNGLHDMMRWARGRDQTDSEYGCPSACMQAGNAARFDSIRRNPRRGVSSFLRISLNLYLLIQSVPTYIIPRGGGRSRAIRVCRWPQYSQMTITVVFTFASIA